MIQRLKKWWKKSTLNEKLMYALILVLVIGISTRWRYVFGEIGDAFTGLFSSEQHTEQPTVKKPQFTIPTIPSMIQGTPQATDWLAEHFWDNADFSDSSYAKYPAVMELALAQWGEVLLSVNDQLTPKAVKAFLQKTAADSAVLRTAVEKIEWAFYDPNSPIRNFEAYIAALEWITTSEKLTELEKMRPQDHLKRVLKNRKGTKANDITYTNINGAKGSLYAIKTPYTLLFFNNPGCPACREYKEELAASSIVSQMVKDKQLTVLGVFPDEDKKTWTDEAKHFPSTWINSIDEQQKIREQDSYELNVIPTLLLLDKDKIVLLKDARPAQVEQYLKELQK